MTTYSIKDKDLFRIVGAADNNYYGSNQEWYMRRWQRMSGCGPSAVANIIYYLNRSRNANSSCCDLTKEECLRLMNEIWEFVTPSLGGVSSTAMLCKGVNKYLANKNLNLKLDFIDIPIKKKLRPEDQKVISFITEALEKDSPVAFLNLEHGTVYELESWHWVTVISLEVDTNNTSFAIILDGGLVKRINLSQWLHTTKLGGGFVSFHDEIK